MSIEIKYFENRKDWRKWLNDNFEIANEVWFVFPSKSSGEKSITYNDAVEEALCFEWIDSTIKSLDKEHKIQHFTPRNPKSTYSQANKERLKWLLENKMIHPKFEDKIRNVLSDPFIFPNDIIERLNTFTRNPISRLVASSRISSSFALMMMHFKIGFVLFLPFTPLSAMPTFCSSSPF